MKPKANTIKIGGGLKPHVPDKRDYSHHKTFGSIPVSQLPEEYLLLSTVLNQGATEDCSAFSSCAVAESQFGASFDPIQFYASEGIEAGAVSNDGYDMRTTMATAVDQGFVPVAGGAVSKEGGYFIIDGLNDLFDNIRIALAVAEGDKMAAECGTMWYQEWTDCENGVIPTTYSAATGLHAIKFAGWTKVKRDGTPLPALPNGDPYGCIQNSYGTGVGDNGIYYFPRSVVNKEFTEGHYLWRTISEQISIQTQYVGILKALVNLYKILVARLKPSSTS